MRVSEFFKLNRKQPTLEFIDVDVYGDTEVFLDPSAIRSIDSDWSRECLTLLQSFFGAVLTAMQEKNDSKARRLLSSLSEPNDTHLGLSKGKASGKGMGNILAQGLWRSMSKSKAIDSGLLEDLEDTVLFVDGIGHDIVSDITTNIIRGSLLKFTEDAANYYQIPLSPDVNSGPMWDYQDCKWEQEFVPRPMTTHGPLLLVPKSIVRRSQAFDPGEYYQHHILPALQEAELRAGSALVHTLADGRKRVTKKDLKNKYGNSKDLNLQTTLKDPDILAKYRAAKRNQRRLPDHQEIADITNSEAPDWSSLLNNVLQVPAGRDHANAYHLAVEALLTALFYPALDMPKREHSLHDGRKRIDITYENIANSGFFRWVATHYTAPYVFVECKNYGKEISNPEVDQLSGRFASNRGRVGFLLYRGFGDKEALMRRCRDTASDNRGYIIPIDDSDLKELVSHQSNATNRTEFPLLRSRFSQLVY